MTHRDDERALTSRAEEFLQLFKKGAEFTQELLRENERLRYRLLALEESARRQAPPPGERDGETERLRRRVEELEREKEAILGRVKEVEEENLDFANRYVEIESENNMLANLYVASHQLHSTLNPREVLQIVSEIIINMVGAEEFAILLVDEKNRRLQAVASEGVEIGDIPLVTLGEGPVGEAASSGTDFFADDLETEATDLSRPIACIPLKIKEQVIGVIAIYRLLVQKKAFAPVDFELFSLLAGHAATAIFSSKLYSESERKRSTIQGFIELMTR